MSEKQAPSVNAPLPAGCSQLAWGQPGASNPGRRRPGATRSSARLANRSLAPALVVLLAVVLAPLVPAGAARAQTAAGGVETITGTVTITNPLIGRVLSQPFINLTDMTAFVERDLLLPLPSPVQTTANIEGDLGDGATFRLPLPIRPEGETNDVAHGAGDGVQIFAVDFQANSAGDPFLDEIEMQGWPTAITSVAVELGTNEVDGGQLAVWAADDAQAFPTGFGPDGLLFTADDPVGPVAAGWTVVDLNAEPFARLRDPVVDVPIIEGEVGLRDLSDLGFVDAFDALVAELRLRYPYSQAKGLDWNAIAAELRPEVEAAERAGDQEAFNVAVMKLTIRMNDGHVAVDPPGRYLIDRYGGGVGLALGRADDGQVIVRCVAAGSPAAAAGIEAGAAIVAWDGRDPLAVAAEREQIFAESTALGLELQRLLLLARMPAGTRAEVAYRNPGVAAEATATLRAKRDEGGLVQPCGIARENPADPPVTVDLLPSGIGYVKVDTFADDMTMMTATWEWALRELRRLDAPALIVDMRTNGGGVSQLPIYFAGSFYDEPFTLAEQIFVDEAGEPLVTAIDRVDPAPVPWRRPVAVLIGNECASACELFAAAMARDPEHLLVGRTPTAGVEGGVFPWLLPGDLSFRAPLIGFQQETGEIFVEGSGVPPNVVVPTTADSLVLPEATDAVLAAAEAALGERLGARTNGRDRADAPAPEAIATPEGEDAGVVIPGG